MDDYPKATWSEWSERIITRYDLKKQGNEWHGACPSCGHNDWPSTRFWINPSSDGLVKFQCRQCQSFTDIVKLLEHDGCWPLLNQQSNVVPIQSAMPGQFDDLTPYHTKKGVELIGASLEGTDVVVPLFNTKQQQVGSQTIKPDGQKRFNKGLKKDSGGFGVVGQFNPTNPGKVWIAEGWATSVSVQMALNKEQPVIFALDKSNLAPVCEALALEWPSIDIYIASDNDANGGGQEAAKKTGKPYAVPKAKDTDWNDVHQSLGLDHVSTGLRKLITPQSIMDELVWINDAQPVLSSNYLIKGWLGKEQMCVIYGQSNVGKSFFTLDMAYHVAAGRDWHEHRVKQGVVLYMAAEGGSGYLNRARAIQDHYGDEDVPLAIRPCPINLLDPNADIPQLFTLIDMVKEQYGEIQLIIIDTLSRALAGGNENAPEAMTAYISCSDMLRDHAQCTVLTVHHSGKANDGARGHSSLRAATDTEIELAIDETSGLRFAKATKQREIASNKEFAFELNTVTLGMDEDGDEVTSCYITPVDEERQREAKIKLTKNEKIITECFTQLWGEQIGKTCPSGAGWPEGGTRWIISEDDLRNHYYGKVTTTNKRQAYQRAMDGLLGKGEMAKNEGFYWLLRQEHKIRLT